MGKQKMYRSPPTMTTFTEVKITRSPKRRRTVSAKVDGEALIVAAPARMSERELQKIVEGFKVRFAKRERRKELARTEDLAKVAERFNKALFDGKLKVNSIEYVTSQTRKYGVCYCHEKRIRLNHRLADMPKWVRDYVIVHELAHLVEPNHGKRFWELVNRYKYTERAKGYLLAKGMEEDEADW